LLLFLPATPLLFMGQEWAASSPFLFFTDHEAELGKAVTSGRRKEFAHFVQFQSADPSQIPDPQAEATFARSRLNWHEREVEPHAGVLRLYRLLLGLRRNDPVIREAPEHNLVAKAVGPLLFVERWLDEDRRWLFVNFGKEAVELPLGPSSVRALASSSDVRYRGRRLPPHSAIILSNG
jgi:maltooligosyltrehalose trehalohydrolase